MVDEMHQEANLIEEQMGWQAELDEESNLPRYMDTVFYLIQDGFDDKFIFSRIEDWKRRGKVTAAEAEELRTYLANTRVEFEEAKEQQRKVWQSLWVELYAGLL